MVKRSNKLARHPLFNIQTEFMSKDERVALSYQRAKLIVQTYALTASEVQHCSPRYWELFTDPVVPFDGAVFTILACHYTLAIGTLSRHIEQRPDLEQLMNSLLRFDTVGLYLVTERGHGLDAFNIETTATKTSRGWIINTPREEACKFMPASTPAFGYPKVAVVMCRMLVDGEDRGLRFFIIPVCNEREMYKGVESIRLGPRSGTNPLDFSITRFNNVLVPHSALVTSDLDDISAPEFPLMAWWDEIWRIPVGSMGMVATAIPAIKASAYIVGKYSMHRSFSGKGSEQIPIITFRTQQWPILQAIAIGFVLEHWYSITASQITNDSLDPRVRHGFAVTVKATISRQVQRAIPEVSERCGAQGTFENNTMATLENDIKGMIIAEGDVLTLCIRLFSELLLERYQMPIPDRSESLIAAHAWSLLEENRALLKQLPKGHRDDSYNTLVLPQAELAIEAIGHAMAYSAAVKKGLPKPILDIYECAVIRRDPAWYSEKGGLTRLDQRVREDKAITSAMPYLSTYLDDLDMEEYVSAPIVSPAAWKKYYNSMSVYRGNAVPFIDQPQARL